MYVCVCARACVCVLLQDEAARVVELSVYCMEESARCYHQLGQCVILCPGSPCC